MRPSSAWARYSTHRSGPSRRHLRTQQTDADGHPCRECPYQTATEGSSRGRGAKRPKERGTKETKEKIAKKKGQKAENTQENIRNERKEREKKDKKRKRKK